MTIRRARLYIDYIVASYKSLRDYDALVFLYTYYHCYNDISSVGAYIQ